MWNQGLWGFGKNQSMYLKIKIRWEAKEALVCGKEKLMDLKDIKNKFMIIGELLYNFKSLV